MGLWWGSIMMDKTVISEDLLHKILAKLEELKKETRGTLRPDADLLMGLLTQLGTVRR